MPEKNKLTKKRRPHSISFKDAIALTKQSFKDECDVNQIVERFTRTGKLDHLVQMEPQYGDAPDQTFFEAACIGAESASAFEDNPELGSESKEPENGSQEPTEDPVPGLDDLDPENAHNDPDVEKGDV